MKKLAIILIPFLCICSCNNYDFEPQENTGSNNSFNIQKDTSNNNNFEFQRDNSNNNNFELQEVIIGDGNSIRFQDRVLENGIPIQGATVSLYGNGTRYFDVTNSNGKYSITIPANSLLTDGFISVNIFHPEYKPLNITYQSSLQPNSVYDSKNVSSRMDKCADCLQILNDNYSELYHLGDDGFVGSINSQFQKNSDGLEVSFDFTNVFGRSKLKVSFEAKGIQPNLYTVPSMVIYGEQSIYLDRSPIDGSYKVYSLEFENDPTVETIKFKTSSPQATGDVDDWEFTSFHIEATD